MNEVYKDIEDEKKVCQVGHLIFVDNFLRKIVHNPKKLFGGYLEEGMTVIDIGCGGGFVTVGFAEMVGRQGKVIAADLQAEMLEITKNRVKRASLEERVVFHKCSSQYIGYDEKVDFALAFFMVHETPDIPAFLAEVYDILRHDSLFFISEPTFHVSEQAFHHMIKKAIGIGFEVHSYPRVILGRNVILKKP